ncbi:MAG: family 43 glycosylhydrolase [Candidatus Krumholzibacteria bacterium]|nr:family 43 glycosylhydrolase [Candidatus Krumholzibacteria bacterium]
MFRLLTLMAAAPAVLVLFFAAGCEETSYDAADGICCDSGADPVFLHSKIDDEDGDGNILDENFPTIDDEDDDIADHTWIRDEDGLYHLFFHTEDRGSGSYIEHYTSSNLTSLNYAGVALRHSPDGWDSYNLWAPHVVRAGNTYFMFYTGTDGPAGDPATRQRIGLATSTDLIAWTRCPINNCPGTLGDGCIYECKECWTTWGGESGSYNQQCRDPFVMWDPSGRRWLMFATAKSTNQYGVVTVASSRNLVNWTGQGFIDATRRLETGVGGQTTGGQCENPFVTSHNSVHYLLFTDWQDPEDSVSVQNPRTIVQYATSSTLAVDSTGSIDWVYRGYIPDPGVNAIEVLRIDAGTWIMSQSISNERSGYWPLRRQLRLKCIVWGDDFAFDTSNVRFDCGIRRRSLGSMAADDSN